MAVGAEDAAQELAHHRDRAALVQHERRQRRRLSMRRPTRTPGSAAIASRQLLGSTIAHLRSS